MTAFTWNSGGDWGNKSWSNELPTDSALVFFLFAAFLQVRSLQPWLIRLPLQYPR